MAWEKYANHRKYTCGYCGTTVSSVEGWRSASSNDAREVHICPECNRGTYFGKSDFRQVPGVTFGRQVEHVSDHDLNRLYNEARRCTSEGAYTAAVLCCRKILMHIAVERGAPEQKPFTFYVKYLDDNHWTPPNGSMWVDQIRKLGNEANHEIVLMSAKQAKQLLSFVEMLLRFIYEFPARAGEAEQ